MICFAGYLGESDSPLQAGVCILQMRWPAWSSSHFGFAVSGRNCSDFVWTMALSSCFTVMHEDGDLLGIFMHEEIDCLLLITSTL
jgi:hypothetical protein